LQTLPAHRVRDGVDIDLPAFGEQVGIDAGRPVGALGAFEQLTHPLIEGRAATLPISGLTIQPLVQPRDADVFSRKTLCTFMFSAILDHPVTQRACVDPEISSNLRDRFSGLPDDAHRTLPELPVELPACL
jgi:hypothetical protein